MKILKFNKIVVWSKVLHLVGSKGIVCAVTMVTILGPAIMSRFVVGSLQCFEHLVV